MEIPRDVQIVRMPEHDALLPLDHQPPSSTAFGLAFFDLRLLRRPTSDTPYSACCASTMPESQPGMSRGSARKCHGLGDWRISGSGVEREDCGVRGQGALPAVASFNIPIALSSPLAIREKRRKETKFMSSPDTQCGGSTLQQSYERCSRSEQHTANTAREGGRPGESLVHDGACISLIWWLPW